MTPSIEIYAAPPDKFFVNSFIIETDAALVVVDTQFLVSTARELAEIVASKRKPLAGIIVTHPHPDHFNGLPILLEHFGPVPVYANQVTIDTIRATQKAKREAWTPVYGEDYPKEDALPDQVIGQNQTLHIAGVDLRITDLGPGESADITVIHLPRANALIASDLIYNRCHPWLAEHRTEAWLKQLDRVEAEYPKVARVLPGHGAEAGRELFQHQRRYIHEQREAVARLARNGVLDEAGLAAVRAVALSDRKDWPLEGLIDMNAAALAAELQETQT